ncbi:MAG: DUF4332 domain-containing protein [Candidatus Sericytochromatia bacterium]|nr:DUF4332 domain-containing protein [Candidatus Sericytochromatia bacterium]
MSTIRTLMISLLLSASAVLPAGCAKAPVASAPQGVASVELDASRAYSIENLLGIGPVYGRKLREAGITSTSKLKAATETRYERQRLAAQADVPYKLVMAWSQKVALMEIPGIGPRQSNLLAAVGVESVEELARRSPENLHERLAVANTFKPRFVENTPSRETVEKWVTAARREARRHSAE